MKKIWLSPQFATDEVESILKGRGAFERVFQKEDADILVFKYLGEVPRVATPPFKEGVKVIYTEDNTGHIKPDRIPLELLPNTLASL